MKIKKLEMVGFKSFVDRTVVKFDHDVLAIVGPNGCGKSNIVDAIRWCMGEQSAKHLRGRSMEDVIFSGSETRAAHDFAEVTLTFENDDQTLPPEYNEYPEIAVTRRLHRNGDSEYLINKTPVRLKDITDLFLGTGAGTKAYAIVEQGKIGLIVSAKPEDRRLLIEEAAGITKFKSRKKQAERKMELTQQNLLRVGDIVAEIERSLGSLKRQAAKAERYLAYRGELEDLQLHEASHKYLELVGWVKLETREVERLTALADAARSELAAREAELETARLEAHASEDALEKAQNANFAAENDVRTEESAIERARDKLGALRAREEQARGELAEIANRAAELARERDLVANEVAELENDETLRVDLAWTEEERLGHLLGDHQRAETTARELRTAAGKAQADIAAAEAVLAGFERRQAEMHERLDRLKREREEMDGAALEDEARSRELARAVEDLRAGKVTSAEEAAQLESSLAGLRQRIAEQERALDEARGEFAKKRSRLHALEEVRARLEGVGAGARALIEGGDGCVRGLVADRIEAPAEFTQALAGLLGNRIEDVLVDDVGRGVALLEELARSRAGRATVVPLRPRYVAGAAEQGDVGGLVRLAGRLRYLPDDEPLVLALVGDALVAPDHEAALHARTEGVRGTIVTVDGTVFHPDGRISGGQGEEVAAGMLDTKRETRELAELVERLERDAAARLSEHQASRAAIVETGSALDRARRAAHEGELLLVKAEKDLDQATRQLDATRRRLEALSGEQRELLTAMQEAGRERTVAAGALDDARTVLVAVSHSVTEAEKAATEWRERVEAQRHVVTEHKVDVAKAREKLAAARGTLSRLTRSTEELSDRGRRLDDELVEGARLFGQTAAQIVAHRARLGDSLDAAAAAASALSAARTAFDALRAGLAEREAGLKDLRTRVDEAKGELGTHEMAQRERELAILHLLESVADRFRGLALDRVIGDYHLRPPPDDEHRGRIQELANLLDRMGSVNLEAMKEHEEAAKRFEFYSGQKADLEKALADLGRAIQQMNRESRRLFQQTFEAVNERFQEIFPRMFRGGRASLRMTNPDDLLETGIDILAQPPGKRLSSIELMSGGEKALTAVSLIFAIFQIKPSPFCVLDEVDAPLDEANVARYNDLVRSMTDRSQFILITHVKRTMQMVDVLYGVTMPEAGVSKIVSVKVNEAAESRRVPVSERAAVA